MESKTYRIPDRFADRMIVVVVILRKFVANWQFVLFPAIALTLAFLYGTASATASIALKCPSFGPNTPAGMHPGPLAPVGPQSALLCHYASGIEKAKTGTLLRAVKVANPKLLAKLLNQGKLAKGLPRCPIDYRGQIVVIFVAKGMETDVSIQSTGCQGAISTNTSEGWMLSKKAKAALAKLDPGFKPWSMP